MDHRGRPAWELTDAYALQSPTGVVASTLAVETQPVRDSASVTGAFMEYGVEYVNPFSAARLWGEVLVSGTGKLYVECLSGEAWVTLGDTTTAELSMATTGFQIGTICLRRMSFSGDVVWRVRADGTGASVRNVALQWLKGYPSTDDDDEEPPPDGGDDPECAFYNVTSTLA